MAAAMGRPYMPWQQHIADVAGEVQDVSGRLAYNEVIVTVPRQSGKTTLILSVVVGRAEAGPAFGGRQKMLYAAQTREAAREKWQEDYLEDLRASPVMRGRFTERVANGSEKITFSSSRSTFGPIATKGESGHGKVLDFGCLDEAFAQPDDRVEGAWLPAMITRPMAQFWVPSTAGTIEATYFRGKVDAGRDAAEADAGTGIAYVEYSADEEAAPDDESVWWGCMPALGYTQTIESMRREFLRMKLNNFRRAFLNQWVDRVSENVFKVEDWEACRNPEAQRASRPVLALDVSADREWATIAMGAVTADNVPMVRIVQHAPGTAWVVDKILELKRRYDIAAVVADSVGPVRSLVPALAEVYVDVETMTTPQMVGACGALFDAVKQHAIIHLGEPPLESAVTGAEKRELGDAWAWTRKKSLEASAADISPLVAVTCALWGQTNFGDPAGHTLTGSYG